MFSGTNKSQATENEKMFDDVDATPIEIVRAETWRQFKAALEETYMENGYSFNRWNYLGCDAKYHYAETPPATILRVKKGLASPDELAKMVRQQRQRFSDNLVATRDLDLPWVDRKHSGPFYRWLKEARLDTSLYDQAEKACRDSRLKKEEAKAPPPPSGKKG
jgi:hypothetical protein